MPIQALPQTTVRALGATQVLTDPAALVKELVDNALDANATSIAIEIHNNTIDTIQVRDNGHGIAPEDRPLLARRYCTSKVSNEEDLNHLGSTSLGFRGEALASAVELCGSMTVTTRIEGDSVAAVLSINRQGEVTGQERASTPVGTTVRIHDFLEAHPVRRKVVLQNAENCLKRIKAMLQAYAFARPKVRVALRVLKSKNTKADWVYAPKPDCDFNDVALKVVGAACVSQCTWSIVEERGFRFQALLPKPDALAVKINNIGSFISVDRRPVSSTRGTFKQILKAFRRALKRSASASEDIKDPFLFLQMECPAGSYDVNVEPAKDDMLFEDPSVVLDAIKDMFTAVYPSSEDGKLINEAPPSSPDRTYAQKTQELDGFTTSLEIPLDPTAAPTSEENAGDTSNAPAPISNTFRSTMYGCDEEDLNGIDPLGTSPAYLEVEAEEFQEARNNLSISNPWVRAKLNSSIRRQPLKSPPAASSQPVIATSPVSSSPMVQRSSAKDRFADNAGLLTPRPSSPPQHHDGFNPSDHVPKFRFSCDGRLVSPSGPVQPQRHKPDLPSEGQFVSESGHSTRSAVPHQYNYDPISANVNKPFRPPLKRPSRGDRSNRAPRRNGDSQNTAATSQPHSEPQQNKEKVWFDHLEHVDQPRHGGKGRARPKLHRLVTQGDPDDSIEDPHPLTPPRGNRDIREFVDHSGNNDICVRMPTEEAKFRDGPGLGARTADVSNVPGQQQQQPQQVRAFANHGFVPASELEIPEVDTVNVDEQNIQPTKRRRTRSSRALVELSPNAQQQTRNVMQDKDTSVEAPTVRRNTSHKIPRRTSSRVPLERTPASQSMQNIIYHSTASAEEISIWTRKIDQTALASIHSNSEMRLAFSDIDLQELTNNLHNLLVRVGSDDDAEPGSLYRELSMAFSQREMNVE